MSDDLKTVKLIEAKFIGLDGSCGFEANKVYKLLLKVDSMKRVYIEDIECGCRYCNYTNTILFLQYWDNIKTKFL